MTWIHNELPSTSGATNDEFAENEHFRTVMQTINVQRSNGGERIESIAQKHCWNEIGAISSRSSEPFSLGSLRTREQKDGYDGHKIFEHMYLAPVKE